MKDIFLYKVLIENSQKFITEFNWLKLKLSMASMQTTDI